VLNIVRKEEIKSPTKIFKKKGLKIPLTAYCCYQTYLCFSLHRHGWPSTKFINMYHPIILYYSPSCSEDFVLHISVHFQWVVTPIILKKTKTPKKFLHKRCTVPLIFHVTFFRFWAT
jgi:hypothetical protein